MYPPFERQILTLSGPLLQCLAKPLSYALLSLQPPRYAAAVSSPSGAYEEAQFLGVVDDGRQ
jgi:hypothetical protein